MTRATTANLNLAIELGSDPISGSVSNGMQLSQPFTGWIELVAAIEAARSSETASTGFEESSRRGGQTLGFLPGAKVPEL